MATRSTPRMNYESYDSDASESNVIPPWCSSGRVHERRELRKVTPVYNIKSFHPRRKNIWEYLNDDKAGNFDIAKRKSKKKLNKQTLIKRFKSRKSKLLTFFLLALGLIFKYLTPEVLPKMDIIIKIISKTNLSSYMGMDSAPMNEECCHRMKHLVLALNRAEQALSILKYRKPILTQRNIHTEFSQSYTEIQLIDGTWAEMGENTTEWVGNVALWGILPLWRAAPPPSTVLKLLRPTPSDCWPFRGSYGELIIDLRGELIVTGISVEHIRPDTARSAPKSFIVFGILGNSTWTKAADGIYEYNKPAKQYFRLDNENIPFQQIVFRVLSNQGNIKYTCIYRIRLYADNLNLIDNKQD